MTRGETKVTIPYPESLSPTSLADCMIYLQCKRRDHGLSAEKVEVLSVVFSKAGKNGISASAISSYFTGGKPGKTALFTVTQEKLKWLREKGWLEFKQTGCVFLYRPAKKTIDFFKVQKPAA